MNKKGEVEKMINTELKKKYTNKIGKTEKKFDNHYSSPVRSLMI